MNGFKDIFGPLGQNYCFYFYYLSIFGFVFMVFTILSYLWVGISKRLGGEHYLHMISLSLIYFIWYFQNRLLYSMCVKSI